MSNKQKYELKFKNKIFFLNFIIKARQGLQDLTANFLGIKILASNMGEFAVPEFWPDQTTDYGVSCP